eukprot:scaffold451_cov365-Prasinococcus_capsulatus_cf.AAC.2
MMGSAALARGSRARGRRGSLTCLLMARAGVPPGTSPPARPFVRPIHLPAASRVSAQRARCEPSAPGSVGRPRCQGTTATRARGGSAFDLGKKPMSATDGEVAGLYASYEKLVAAGDDTAELVRRNVAFALSSALPAPPRRWF